jgi:hypothetical protein
MLSTSYFLNIARFHHMNPKEMIRKYTYLVVHFNISELNNFIKNGSHPSVYEQTRFFVRNYYSACSANLNDHYYIQINCINQQHLQRKRFFSKYIIGALLH